MIKIRKFTEKDAEEASRLIRRAVKEVNSEVYPEDVVKNLYDFFSSDYLVEMAKEDDLILAVEEKKILGTARLKQNRIQTVFVDPNYHRQGIGTALMNSLENLALKRGIQTIKLSAAINAIGFYKKLGYTDTKERFEDELGLVFIVKKPL